MSDMNTPPDDNSGSVDDLWAEALNEQQSTTSKSAADAVFQQLGGGDVSGWWTHCAGGGRSKLCV